MSATTAHLLCLALFALDLTVRTWRTKVFLFSLGVRISFRDVFVQSAIGEAASSLTPLRAGGEPIRIWAMGVQGVPSRIAIVAVGLEFVAVTVIIMLVALSVGFAAGGDWWRAAGPGVMRSAARGWPWLAGVALLMLGAWLLVRRARPEFLHIAGSEFAAARGHMRDVPFWTYLACTGLSALQIATRVAVLPILAMTLPAPPPLVATAVGSFALIYAQAIFPAPAGAGAVDLGFLSGAAGNLGAMETELLAWWRFYTTILGVLLGLALGVLRFHTNIFALLIRRP